MNALKTLWGRLTAPNDPFFEGLDRAMTRFLKITTALGGALLALEADLLGLPQVLGVDFHVAVPAVVGRLGHWLLGLALAAGVVAKFVANLSTALKEDTDETKESGGADRPLR